MLEPLIELFRFIQTGILGAVLFYSATKITQLISPYLGIEKPNDDWGKRAFDQFYEWLLADIERDIGTLTTNKWRTQLLLTVTISSVVGLFAIALEVWGMIAITGLAIAGYEILGVTMNISMMYHTVAYLAVLLTMALIFKGRERARFIAKHQ